MKAVVSTSVASEVHKTTTTTTWIRQQIPQEENEEAA
jgi:hypothetical protein